MLPMAVTSPQRRKEKNTMADVKNSVWVGELDRFGCTLTVVGQTEEEVTEALMNAYEKTYRDVNDDLDPREETSRWGDKSDYESAKEDIYAREMIFGRVEWA